MLAMNANTSHPNEDPLEWKHTATRDAAVTDEDPMLGTYEFMNVRTGEVKTIVAYSLEEAEQKIAARD